MAEPLTIETRRISDVTRLTKYGDIQSVKRVEFMVGHHGPFYLEFTAAEFIPEKVKAAQEAIASTIRGL